MLILRPQPIAGARLQPPRAPGTLGRRSTRNTPGFQTGHATAGIEPRHPRQPGIDHHPHALDGQAGLGNVGRQHHLALTRRRRLDGGALGGQLQLAVQRTEHYLASICQLLGQQIVHTTYLSLPRQEHQHAARLLIQRLHHRLHDPRFNAFTRLERSSPALHDRKHAALAAHHRCVIQQSRQPRAFQRGGHEQQLERFIAQQNARIEGQRQGQIGVQAALVKFVEDHQTHAFKGWIVLQATRKDAFGDDFDAGVRPDLAVQPDAIADGFANLLAQLAGQALSRRTGRQPARFEHDDRLPAEPWLVQQGQRHSGGLAGTGRSFEHRFIMR